MVMKVKRIATSRLQKNIGDGANAHAHQETGQDAARRMPVPVAESQLRLKMAGSAAAVGTAGGMRRTI